MAAIYISTSVPPSLSITRPFQSIVAPSFTITDDEMNQMHQPVAAQVSLLVIVTLTE